MRICAAFRRLLLRCSVGFCFTLSIAASASPDVYYQLDFERQSLVSALNRLAKTAGFIWGATFDDAEQLDKTIEPIKGRYTTRQAVAELFKNSGIDYQWTDSGLLITEKKGIKNSPPSEGPSVPQLEEITVIGSHIRGSNSAAPVFQFNRSDIENSGSASTQEFIASLPQIFGGGAKEGAIFAIKGEGAKLNIADANGVNLFGLGYDGTLVLLNGRRMAPVGFGDVVDVSGIPLNAIERIDIMADGASAIYGSDAVGGVVNIILRRHYNGSETLIGYGDVASGSHENYRFSQTLGKRWSSGSALLSYNYRQRDRLGTENRPSTQNAAEPSDILGENAQHDTIFSLSQHLTERADIYVDALYSRRKTEQNQANFGNNAIGSRSVNHYSLASGGGIDLNDNWRVDAGVLYSGSSTVLETVSILSSSVKSVLDTRLLDIKLDGELFGVWGGAAKLALGGQYRREAFTFERESTNLLREDRSSRDIAAVFTELFVPLAGEGNNLPGLKRLEFTLAGRHEDYSDFGGTTNPKAGLLWSPVTGLNLRATYSESFRAPLLFEMSDVVNFPQISAISLPDVIALKGDVTPTLLVSGSAPKLRPEKAINRTIGADITPVFWPSLKLSLTYFSIDVTDRIQTAIGDSELLDALIDPRYAPVVMRNPDMALVNFWASQPIFQNFTDVSSLSEIGAFIDNRLSNTAALRERGLDITLDYVMDSNLGKLAFQLRGTYLLALESRATETAPFVDILNSPYNPVDLKLRNSVSWKRNGLIATAYVNYVGSYKDVRSGQKDVDAWTTVDLNIRYQIKQSERSWWQDTTVSLSVSNLFDKEPPFVANELGYNFDATNANAIGRRISLEFTKKW